MNSLTPVFLLFYFKKKFLLILEYDTVDKFLAKSLEI